MEIPIKLIGNIFRTKEELYTLIRDHGGYYLPPISHTPVQFLNDVLLGKKLLLKYKDVETTGEIPRIEEFRVKSLWDLIKARADFRPYFPDIPDSSNKLPDRKYMMNVMNTLEADVITTVFAEAMKKRKELNFKEAETKKTVEMKPEWWDIIFKADQKSKRKGKILPMMQRKNKVKRKKIKKFTSRMTSDFKLDFKPTI